MQECRVGYTPFRKPVEGFPPVSDTPFRMACNGAVLGLYVAGVTFANVLCNGLAVGPVLNGMQYRTSGKDSLLCWPALPVLVPVAVLSAKRNRLRFRCIPLRSLGLGAVLRC